MLPSLLLHSLPALLAVGAAILSTYLNKRGHVYLAFLVIWLMVAADIAILAGAGVFHLAGFKWIVGGATLIM
jgi:hypothetical protein